MAGDSDNNKDESQNEQKESEQKTNVEGSDEEKIDKSLDEVSNVIHDILIEPSHEDTDEEVNENISETKNSEPSKKDSDMNQKFKKFKGLFKKKEIRDESVEISHVEETVEKEFSPEHSPKIPDQVVESLLEPKEINSQYTSDKKYTFDEFIDERILISKDAFGKKEMKIKVLEVSDEKAPTVWKLGDRVKLNKILITVKHLETQEIEEGEFDIQSIEKELIEKRHYTSTNRWVPTTDIKNGYVVGSRHTSLVSDAIALDYIMF